MGTTSIYLHVQLMYKERQHRASPKKLYLFLTKCLQWIHLQVCLVQFPMLHNLSIYHKNETIKYETKFRIQNDTDECQDIRQQAHTLQLQQKHSTCCGVEYSIYVCGFDCIAHL